MTTRPLTALTPGVMASTPCPSQSGAGTVSSSVKAMISPRALRQPRLRAAAGPRWPVAGR